MQFMNTFRLINTKKRRNVPVALLGEGGGPPRKSPFWGDTIL